MNKLGRRIKVGVARLGPDWDNPKGTVDGAKLESLRFQKAALDALAPVVGTELPPEEKHDVRTTPRSFVGLEAEDLLCPPPVSLVRMGRRWWIMWDCRGAKVANVCVARNPKSHRRERIYVCVSPEGKRQIAEAVAQAGGNVDFNGDHVGRAWVDWEEDRKGHRAVGVLIAVERALLRDGVLCGEFSEAGCWN